MFSFQAAAGGSKPKKFSVFTPDKMGNFEPPPEEPRSGPGEGGKAHVLLPEQRNEATQSISEFGMNMVVSDEISLSRTIIDTRVPEYVCFTVILLNPLYSSLLYHLGVNIGTILKICPK